jgi:signal transduction histidine kinase
MHWFDGYRYLTRLNVPSAEADSRRVEMLLAVARVLFAFLALVAVALDPPQPVEYLHAVNRAILVWIAYSAAVLGCIVGLGIRPAAVMALHIADIAWPALIMAVSHGVSVPFVAIYCLALVAAAFRWGFPAAVATAIAGGLILEIEGLVLGDSGGGVFEHGRLLARCGYLLILGFLIGILGENEKERRAEAAVISRMANAPRFEQSLRSVLQAAFNEYIRLFRPSHLCIAAQEMATGKVYLLQEPGNLQPEALPYVKELLGDERSAALLPDLPDAFLCRRMPSSSHLMVPEGRSLNCAFPALPWTNGKSQTLLGATASLGKEWRLRLMLADARVGRFPRKELAFARLLFGHAATAIYGVYLVRRLRARAGALERARVARELHDGAIQSLVSTELRADLLRRRAELDSPSIAREIGTLQQLLRDQVFELRELMRQLKPMEIEPNRLFEHLSVWVERFRRESGINARFVPLEEEVQLSPHACREVLLILQEALVNIRKHAQATDVLATLGRSNREWLLEISDNGIGFGFEGKLAGAELMKSAKGPAVIKERVANLGGELAIESNPSQGSRLTIKIPQESI